MATTTSYSFTKPTVGGDTDSWGALLNANWDKVDNLLDGTTTVDGIDVTNATGDFSTLDAAGGTLAGMTITGADVTATSLEVTGVITEGAQTQAGTSPTFVPTSGTIARWTLTASTAHTPTITLFNGQSMALIITGAASATITWPTMSWFNGVPTLEDGSENMIELFKDGGTLYGVYVGSVS